jgi:DNA invertase Pin-like site-specific DNA recombinase
VPPRAEASREHTDRLVLLAGLVRAAQLLRIDTHAAAQQLLDEGVSPTLVARALGLSRQQVYRGWRVPPSTGP